MESGEVTQLLKDKYDLHKSPEVVAAARRHQERTGEKVPQDPLAQIGNYLNRFHEITDRQGPQDREHGMDAAKRLLHSKFVIKPDQIPESYFENQKRLAREQGHGDIAITQQQRDQLTEVIIADQESSLDKWVDYLSSPDAPYSDSLKYFTLRSVLNMAEYDKERKTYPQRSEGTTKPFPDLNREALAYVLDVVGKKYKGQNVDMSTLDEEDSKELENLLKGENFAKLYGWAIEKVTPASEDELSATNGEWVKYNQGSDHMPLVQSLQGHGTGWCTAGESTAQIQLQDGDFYVYYSHDRDGNPTIPRAAIRMEEGRIAEVRGISADQNLDGAVIPVVEEKLKEFPDGPSYQKKVADMRLLTEIERKIESGEDLNSTELSFLYELDASIEGFGYEEDPRIAEIRFPRNPQEDMPIVFECEPSQIAHNISQIDKNTKAYVGALIPGIFDKLENIEHVYTSFPERRIRRDEVIIGGKTAEIIESELDQNNINVSSYSKSMIESPDFITEKNPRKIDLVRLHVADLGINKDYPTTTEVYQRAAELGLELCPPETGPQFRLQYTDQPLDGWFYVGMKPITDSNGNPRVFILERVDGGLWLNDDWAAPVDVWSPGYEFVFSLRK